MHPRYLEASGVDRGRMLDEVVVVTGYQRKCAAGLFCRGRRGEFIHACLPRYCEADRPTFGRCREHTKDEQAHVEQKNCTPSGSWWAMTATAAQPPPADYGTGDPLAARRQGGQAPRRPRDTLQAGRRGRGDPRPNRCSDSRNGAQATTGLRGREAAGDARISTTGCRGICTSEGRVRRAYEATYPPGKT